MEATAVPLRITPRKTKKKILLGIGNRREKNLQVVVAEIIRRYGSCSWAEYVVRSLL